MIARKLFTILSTLILAVTCLLPSSGGQSVVTYAAENETSLDKTAVMDDLKDTDLSALNEVTEGIHVVSFVEYCFAYDANYNGNFGLYVYAYNPEQKNVVMNSTLNQISIGTSYNGNEVAGYGKFKLRGLSVSDDGKFIKMKIVDEAAATTGETILSRLNRQKLQRLYDVSEIELVHDVGGGATSYGVGKRYIYTGFAEGYGQSKDSPATLECYTEEAETISFDVYPTQYRFGMSNGKNPYTQDMLHSVYFAIPNEYGEKYGEMTAVHVQWLEAMLAPAYVTGNKEVYNALLPYVGKEFGEDVAEGKANLEDFPYHIFGALTLDEISVVGQKNYYYGFAINPRLSFWANFSEYDSNKGGYPLNRLVYLFDAGEGEDSADHYVLSSLDLQKKIEELNTQFGQDAVSVGGKYSPYLFSSYSSEVTDKTIKGDYEFKIQGAELSSPNWWQKLHGKDYSVNTDTLKTLANIKGIEAVTADDAKLSKEAFCEKMKVADYDYEDFMRFYNEKKENSTVYLFRYRVSDYISQEATVCERSGVSAKEVDTNGYFFREHVDLNFDIIDITLTNTEGDHVIGVAMSPIDVFPSATPPIITTPDKDKGMWDEVLYWIKMIVGIILVVIVLVVVCVVFPPVGTAIIWLIALPFKALGALFKKVGQSFHKKE